MENAETAYRIFANGTDMGTYWGLTRSEAQDRYAKDAGYDNFYDLLKQHDGQITVRKARKEEIENPNT